MVKKAVIELRGCSRAVVEEALGMLTGLEKELLVETTKGIQRVRLYIRRVSRVGDCWEVSVGLSKAGGWLWGEVFEVCVRNAPSRVELVVVRRRGVGRVNADVLGLWIAEWVKGRCKGLVASTLESF